MVQPLAGSGGRGGLTRWGGWGGAAQTDSTDGQLSRLARASGPGGSSGGAAADQPDGGHGQNRGRRQQSCGHDELQRPEPVSWQVGRLVNVVTPIVIHNG